MGRKKGKQAGNFQSKSQNAAHRQTIYVDHASEANQYRNPTADLGRGHGYRNASPLQNDNAIGIGNSSGRWHSNGSCYGGGDKWSSIFSSSARTRNSSFTHQPLPASNDSNINRATMGLSRLRFLLEQRRSEDRVHDRQHRLRLQRSRMREADNAVTPTVNSACNSSSLTTHRHEPGWLLSHSIDTNNCPSNCMKQNYTQQFISGNGGQPSTKATNGIPPLQMIAARALGPLLPMYCAAAGSDFVGESLRSVSASVLSELAISLAMSDWSSERNSHQGGSIFATTDGAVKALVHSGGATGLVLRGAPLMPLEDHAINDESKDDDDTRWLSDNGLLSLCPRLDGDAGINNSWDGDDDGSSPSLSNENWESIDFDTGLGSQMSGCFYLKRLELIDIPLRQRGTSSGGISLATLRTVLRSCPGITHLSLSGCFYNWEDTDCLTASLRESNDISVLLGGTPNISSLANSIKLLGKLHCNDEGTMHLIQQIMFQHMFQDEAKYSGIVGLNDLLPELVVLDVSYCSWLTGPMILQYLLQLWDRAFASTVEICENSSNDSHWEDEEEHRGGDGDIDATLNRSHHPQSDRTNLPNREQCKAIVKTPLKDLNIRGCIGLLASSSTSPSWIEEWRKHGLFDGIHVSTDREFR
eukprot:CAMPEP_0183742680 /NCGR_PEP_ID=MMETSP0737-20130205/64822_1 /TAXON_ID=385413 /ORGANISM="Thalassiosira miniscula, Strain CCMP1093" /LENGTH=641 /DNA_ID=CAMNT_0025978271 /DNA_START=21 /DNA_END=1946 /DNA_ORIENTATION=+